MSTINYTYNVIVDRFRQFAAGHFQLRRFTHGEISQADLEKEAEWPWLHVKPRAINYSPGTRSFSFEIFISDLPRDKEDKTGYQAESITDCSLIFQDLINEIYLGNMFGSDVVLTRPVNAEPFVEQYTHTLTGVTGIIELNLDYDWSACSIPASWNYNTPTDSGTDGWGALQFIESLDQNGAFVSLLNDVEAPGNSYYYGTNASGVKGWHVLEAGGLTCETLPDCATIISIVDDIAALESGKVDKVAGKGLSTEDYTTAEKSKLAGIEAGAEVNVNADWNAVSGDAQILNKPTIPAAQVNSDWNATSGVAEILNKPTIPTSTSDLTNNGEDGINPFITAQDLPSLSWGSITGTLSDQTDLQSALDAKQATGNYITALTGEATATGPGSANMTLSNSAVISKVLTGLNLAGGGTIADTDSILLAFGKIQNQISGLLGGVTFQGVWNASTNTPTLTSSLGTKGYYYIVNVAGSTNLNGITDWKIGDWAVFNGTTWDKVDNTDAVSSVNGFSGAVSLTTADISEVTNLYYTEARVNANANVAANTAARHNAVTISTANGLSLSGQALSLASASASITGALSSTDWSTFNAKQEALVSGTNIKTVNSNSLLGAGNVSVGTVTSVGITAGTGISVSGSPVTSSGSITVTNSAPDQVVALTAGSGIAVTGTYPNFTITNNAPAGGTVTDVTATAPMSSTGGATPNLSMTSANGTTNGYLLSSDWLIFNGKFNTPTGTTLQYLRGDGSLATFPAIPAQYNPTAGTGISITGTYPNQTITNTAPDQTVSLTAGTNIGVTGTYPNFTINNTQSLAGLVSNTRTITINGTAQDLSADRSYTIDKASVGLSNVDNTSDLNKPISTATQTALNAKQDTLVSGTNIKTLEGQSLLGSGNIDLTKSDVGLANVDNTSDLNKPISTATQTALNAKQNTLTLTTTGTSGAATLVGATLNIPQYSSGGGGGGGGAHAFVAPNPAGSFANGMVNVFVYNNNFTSLTETTNRLTAYPFIPFQTIISSALVVRCVTGKIAALGRILIYSNLNGFPNTKLYESTDIDLSTSGDKTVLTTFTFTAGTTYWLAFHSSSNPLMQASQSSNMIPVFSNSSQTYNHYYQNVSFGSSSPTTFSPTTYNIGNVTNISIKL